VIFGCNFASIGRLAALPPSLTRDPISGWAARAVAPSACPALSTRAPLPTTASRTYPFGVPDGGIDGGCVQPLWCREDQATGRWTAHASD